LNLNIFWTILFPNTLNLCPSIWVRLQNYLNTD
jgi:hypothetical protein